MGEKYGDWLKNHIHSSFFFKCVYVYIAVKVCVKTLYLPDGYPVARGPLPRAECYHIVCRCDWLDVGHYVIRIFLVGRSLTILSRCLSPSCSDIRGHEAPHHHPACSLKSRYNSRCSYFTSGGGGGGGGRGGEQDAIGGGGGGGRPCV